MLYKLMQSNMIRSQTISGFYGLNRLEKGNSGEFSDMQGLSSDRYPCISPAKTVKKVFTGGGIQAVIAPKHGEEIQGLTGVAGGRFYYNGTSVSFEDETEMRIPSDAAVTLADFNGRIIICANRRAEGGDESRMYYYGYTASDENKVKRMERGFYNIARYTVSSSGNPKTDYSVTNKIYSADIQWKDCFSEGDAVYIRGLENSANNTLHVDSRFTGSDKQRHISAIVEKIDGHTLYLQLYNHLGERLVFTDERSTSGELDVFINIPTMNHICIHNNRLWGTNPNGEYIYASKLGDPFNWTTFSGLASDSYYAEIGTAGGFVGIVSYRDNLVAFKRDYIHHVYGDKPANFTIPKQLTDCGCIDIRSAVQVGANLYFLGYGGFYGYNGGQPVLISQKLDKRYTRAVAATDGQKYIVSCTDTEGKDELLVYDTRYNVWHREKALKAAGSFRSGDRLYIAEEDAVYEYGGGKAGAWYCESIIINESTFDNTGAVELWIRASLKEGSKIKVLTSEDGGDWVGSFTMDKAGLRRYHITVRFTDGDYYMLRLEGVGDAVILDIGIESVGGGREYSVHK